MFLCYFIFPPFCVLRCAIACRGNFIIKFPGSARVSAHALRHVLLVYMYVTNLHIPDTHSFVCFRLLQFEVWDVIANKDLSFNIHVLLLIYFYVDAAWVTRSEQSRLVYLWMCESFHYL